LEILFLEPQVPVWVSGEEAAASGAAAVTAGAAPEAVSKGSCCADRPGTLKEGVAATGTRGTESTPAIGTVATWRGGAEEKIGGILFTPTDPGSSCEECDVNFCF